MTWVSVPGETAGMMRPRLALRRASARKQNVRRVLTWHGLSCKNSRRSRRRYLESKIHGGLVDHLVCEDCERGVAFVTAACTDLRLRSRQALVSYAKICGRQALSAQYTHMYATTMNGRALCPSLRYQPCSIGFGTGRKDGANPDAPCVGETSWKRL
jgi:hypothetical protein